MPLQDDLRTHFEQFHKAPFLFAGSVQGPNVPSTKLIMSALRQLLVSLVLFTSLAAGAEKATVTRVIDGDTVETSSGHKVRLIGINAPEIQDLFGQEAKQHLTALIQDRTVDLVSDALSSDQDRYQRLLRYVVLDGTDINKRMVEDGFAFAYLKFHFEKSNDYLEAEKKARSDSVGIWASSQTDNILAKERQAGTSHFRSPKAYFIGVLVFLLVCLGIYFYFKK